MKNSYKTSDAIHILIYIELYKGEREMTSTAIAKSVSSNPGVIRRLMAQLSQAGLISTQVGKAVPALTRQASDISMLDVYKAVETECHLLQVDQKKRIKIVNLVETSKMFLATAMIKSKLLLTLKWQGFPWLI